MPRAFSVRKRTAHAVHRGAALALVMRQSRSNMTRNFRLRNANAAVLSPKSPQKRLT